MTPLKTMDVEKINKISTREDIS